MINADGKLTLTGCAVLPPMTPAGPSGAAAGASTAGKAKGKPARRKPAGRFAALNAFVDFSLGGLSRAETAVWMILFRDTKADGLARTSQADMARRAGADPRTVRRALGALQAAGLLDLVRRGGLRRAILVSNQRAGDGALGDTGDTLHGDISRHSLGAWVSPIPDRDQ